MLSFVSFLDDIYEVAVSIRLLVHFICASICVVYYSEGYSLFRGELPQTIDISLSIIGLVFFLNIFNFLDGIDGISALQSAHLAITAILLCIIRDKVVINIDIVFYTSSLMLGCSLGFLIFNWNPAKIFLGDVGSTFFGFIHGLNLLLIASSSERLFLASVIASLYYIADGGLTIIIRIFKREKIWLPHLNHFFQQAVRKGMGHKEVVLKISVCNSILLFCSVMSIYMPHIAIVVSFLSTTWLLIHFQE
ncbi:MAG: UDP-phosphate alpha-N-acetylglucosaminyltransferase [Rickettsiaceae bacterium]|nr:UDP-phosphate alpha-N-acetylglucosaminyltransferase [Rickettsiaceae bacterium]